MNVCDLTYAVRMGFNSEDVDTVVKQYREVRSSNFAAQQKELTAALEARVKVS
jgi:CBS-domain-containing membrane protein